MSPIERFMARVTIDPAAGRDACWVWAGAVCRSKGGPTPVFNATGIARSARRFAFEHFHRVAVDPQSVLQASCRNRFCVNPLHAEPRLVTAPCRKWRRAAA